MDEFTPEFIAEQLALAAKATPRPWRTWDSERGFIGIANNEAVDLGTASRADDVCIISEEVNDHRCAEDATYIVTAANNYPAALDEIERLREAQRWIPVGERMPEFELGTASKYVEVAYRIPGSPNYLRGDVQYWEKYGWVFKWENGKAETFDDYGYIVEFWKPPFPLPQPPQEA
jgi:hypothetical protein